MLRGTTIARPPDATKKEIKTETRQRLLDAAAEEFARYGYVGANVNRISGSAGFAKGTIYNYFPSKRGLMRSLIEETAVAHTDFVLQQVEQEPDPAAGLERFFGAGVAFVERHPARAGVIVNAVYGPDEEFRALVYRAYEGLFALIIHQVVEPGIAEGEFRPVDPDTTAALVMTVYLGSCSQIEADGKIWLDPGQVASFVLDGLRRRTAS